MATRIARVFPARTKYTPDDEHAYFDVPDMFCPEYDEVHVSCLFTWDKGRAEYLANQWSMVCDDVRLGGPAYDDRGGEFTPGLYVRSGYVQTSRGCPNRCSFCFVPKREGSIRELKIHEGPWIMDNNLLACSTEHQARVFDMLRSQKGIKFLGGLEADLVTDWHIQRLAELRSRITTLYTAFDQAGDREPVDRLIRSLYDVGFKQPQICCFVLVGYGRDDVESARERIEWVYTQGATPFASYFRGPEEVKVNRPREWAELTRNWTAPRLIYSKRRLGELRYHTKPIRGIHAEREK